MKQSKSVTYSKLTCYKTLHKRAYSKSKARAQASKILRQNKRLTEKKLIKDIEIFKRNPRLFFDKCKSVKQGYKERASTMKKYRGNLIIDTKKIVIYFIEFFKRILNNMQDNITPYEKIIYYYGGARNHKTYIR